MKRKHEPTKNKVLFNKAMPFFYRYKDDDIRKTYIKQFRDFLKYCTFFHKIEKIEELKGNIRLIREYADWLREQGNTVSTVYAAIVPVCRFCGVDTENFR